MTDTKAADEAAAATEQNGEREKNCFVVIGFGTKTDFATGRKLDLDLTYTKLIRPLFEEEFGIRCFRAIDVNLTGSIDKLMYNWIFHADFVVADLSTMNANVFYELGVRHAQRPGTTFIIAENGIFKSLPFDLSHTVIYGYEHLGEDISDAAVEEFENLLRPKLKELIDKIDHEDSPVYTYLPGMVPPSWQDPTALIAELEAKLEARDALADDAGMEQLKAHSLGVLIERAEAAKDAGEYTTAKALFTAAIDSSRGEDGGENVVDPFLWQRLALVTYKEQEKSDDDAAAIADLREAESILLEKLDAHTSTDPETLGLSGAVNKRMFERTGDREYYAKSLAFYERGFYIKQDYYNGINVAFMYTTEAARLAEAGETFDAIVNYGHAQIIRRKVAEICRELIASEGFDLRDDARWVYQTLAQAHLGLGEDDAAERLLPKVAAASKGDMDVDTFRNQNEDLIEAIATFERLVPQDLRSGGPERAPAQLVEGEPSERLPAVPDEGTRVVRQAGAHPIIVDLGDLAGRQVRSVEVKVEFAE